MVDTVFKLAFQVTPIWLTGRPVAALPGGMLPLAALTDPQLWQDLTGQFVEQVEVWNLDKAFGAFQVLPGGTLLAQDAATYPFANQWVASNATIFNPLQVSLVWDTPMKDPNAWNRKYMIIQNVQARLTDHCNNGGTFTVLTPSFIYEGMLLLNLSDASRGNNPIPQNAWRFDFNKPLVRMTDLLAAQNVLMYKLTHGLETNGAWTGHAAAVGVTGSLTQFMPAALQALPSARGTLTGSGAPP
jgi:hypothetical protein